MAQKNNTRKNPGIFQKIKKTKWYVLLPVIISIALLLNLVYKKVMTKYDISLLDKAETKLRALDLPKADKTTYKRSCSVRSVKFQDPGDPTCHIQRLDLYAVNDNEDQLLQAILDNRNSLKEEYPGTSSNFDDINSLRGLVTEPEYRGPEVNIGSLQKGVSCQQLIGIAPDYSEKLRLNGADKTLFVSTYCSKKFKTLAYPEN